VPVPAEPATVGPLQADGTVQVAFAANQAECDLLRGLLESAGIPSTWRNVGIAAVHWAQVPGARAIYVPTSLAEEAKAALAKPRTA
jgi:hypothetical protein